MKKWNNIYDKYFYSIRRKYTNSALKPATVDRRLGKVIDNLPEIDQHYLYMLQSFGRVSRIAIMNDVTLRIATRRTNIAISHLVTPKNVKEVIGCNIFKHDGLALGCYGNILSTRTINAMKRQGIKTVEDLREWLSFGVIYLYRIPGVGKYGVIEILQLLTKLGAIEIKNKN